MADDTTLNPGIGGDVIATDDIAGVKHQRVKVQFGADGSAQDVDAAHGLPVELASPPSSLPLPLGAATEATLAALSAKTPALGQSLSAGAVPVVLPATQVTALTPPAAITGFALDATLAALSVKVPALGQAAVGGSAPVVLPAAQVTALTPPAAITGFATEATLAGVLTAADFDGKVGAATEAAPATDTASSGLNGRLQRACQRLSSILTALAGGLPAALGGSGGLKVEVISPLSNKTILFATPIPKQIVAASGAVLSADVDVSTEKLLEFCVRWMPLSTTVRTIPPTCYIQGSTTLTGDDGWQELDRWTGTLGANMSTAALNQTDNSGQKVLHISATGNFVNDDFIGVQDVVDVTKSEWKTLLSWVSNTSLTCLDNLSYTHINTAVVWRGAAQYRRQINVMGFKRVRVIASNGLNALANGSIYECVLNSVDNSV